MKKSKLAHGSGIDTDFVFAVLRRSARPWIVNWSMHNRSNKLAIFAQKSYKLVCRIVSQRRFPIIMMWLRGCLCMKFKQSATKLQILGNKVNPMRWSRKRASLFYMNCIMTSKMTIQIRQIRFDFFRQPAIGRKGYDTRPDLDVWCQATLLRDLEKCQCVRAGWVSMSSTSFSSFPSSVTCSFCSCRCALVGVAAFKADDWTTFSMPGIRGWRNEHGGSLEEWD